MTNGAVITTDYAANYIYQNNALQMINQPEGYLEPNFTSSEVVTSSEVEMDYGYRLKVGAQRKSRLCGNHPSVARQVLGNIRLTFVDFDHNGSIALSEITEENNYYPFGLKHQGYNDDYSSSRNAVASKFKYNGKELNDELGLDLYDYGARFYDASLGRFHSLDPLAEKYAFQSTFAYAANNPIRFIDVMGMFPSDDGDEWFEANKAVDEDRAKQYDRSFNPFYNQSSRSSTSTETGFHPPMADNNSGDGKQGEEKQDEKATSGQGGITYGNDFARELQSHYENGKGTDYHLSKERLYDIYNKSIGNGALEWNKAKAMGNNTYQVPANLYKTDYALSFGRASLTIYNDFSGKIYPTGFYDTWDLDPKPWGIRSYPAEIITRYYNWSLTGTNFKVTYP